MYMEVKLPSLEHHCQLQKLQYRGYCQDTLYHLKSMATPRDAYMLACQTIEHGRDCPQWMIIRVSVIRELLEAKCHQCTAFRQRLVCFLSTQWNTDTTFLVWQLSSSTELSSQNKKVF